MRLLYFPFWLIIPFAPILFCFSLLGCWNDKSDAFQIGGRLVLTTAIEPHAFLVERIGGDSVRVEVLVPAGKEPEHYEASPEKIAALSRSRVFFRTGMPFEEAFLPKIKSLCPHLEIVDLRQGIALRKLELHLHDDVDSDSGHQHGIACSHDGLDPHIWFAPTPLKTQAETVFKTLVKLDPDRTEEYRQRFEQFVEELEEIRRTLVDQMAEQRGRTVYVFHPSYGYFCDEFGLIQRALEFEGRSPKPLQLVALIAETKEAFARTGESPLIFVQPEFSRAPADVVAEATGGQTAIHSCLDRDILAAMKRFADFLIQK